MNYNLDIKKETLSNGLQVILVHKPDYQKSLFLLGAKVGGFDIDQRVDGQVIRHKSGIAHYLEHQMFYLDGEDVSDWSLEKKFELAKDPELDYGTFKKVTDTFSKVKIGLDPNVTILNPVTGGPTPYEYDFRLFTVLEAIGNNDIDGVTIDFE